MVRRNYVGIGEPKARFAELKPAWDALGDMQNHVRPFGPDYLVLDAVRKALDTAAYYFTGEPSFYGLKIRPSSNLPRPPTRLG